MFRNRLFDDFLAFTAIGLPGITKNHPENCLYIGISAAVQGRAAMWVADTLSSNGALQIGSTVYSSSLLYFIVYNGTYLIPDTAICLVLAALLGKRLLKIMKM